MQSSLTNLGVHPSAFVRRHRHLTTAPSRLENEELREALDGGNLTRRARSGMETRYGMHRWLTTSMASVHRYAG